MSFYRGKNFNPFSNYVVSASSSNTDTPVTQPSANDGSPITPATDLLVYNAAAVVAFVNWGYSSTAATATTSSVAVAPGAIMTFDMGLAATHVGVILASSSGSVYISIGTGT